MWRLKFKMSSDLCFLIVHPFGIGVISHCLGVVIGFVNALVIIFLMMALLTRQNRNMNHINDGQIPFRRATSSVCVVCHRYFYIMSALKHWNKTFQTQKKKKN